MSQPVGTATGSHFYAYGDDDVQPGNYLAKLVRALRDERIIRPRMCEREIHRKLCREAATVLELLILLLQDHLHMMPMVNNSLSGPIHHTAAGTIPK